MWKAIHFIASNEMDGFCVELCLMGLTLGLLVRLCSI